MGSLMKCYISGRITGLPEHVYRQMFERGCKEVMLKGLAPVNPVTLPDNHEKTWKAYMKADLKALKECDAIYMLTNWPESRGAKIEHWFAKRYGKIVIYQRFQI
jgi:hypothetical protein